MLNGLSKKELNGRSGEVVAWHSDRKRWEVKLHGETDTVAVKADKLSPAQMVTRSPSEGPLPGDSDFQEEESPLDERERAEAEEEIQKLRHVSLQDVEGEVCAVCIENLEKEDRFNRPTKLPCGHHFHFDCVLPWLQEHARCPCCRAPICRAE